MQKPAFTDILSGILLYLFKAKTKRGAVNKIAVTYPGFAAMRKAKVLAIMRMLLKVIT